MLNEALLYFKPFWTYLFGPTYIYACSIFAVFLAKTLAIGFP